MSRFCGFLIDGKAGMFPVRRKPDEWTSGKIKMAFRSCTTLPQHATTIIANFKHRWREIEEDVRDVCSGNGTGSASEKA
jgi:hypothetical protein